MNGELKEGKSGLRLLFTAPIFFLKPFDPSGGIQELLLSREKRMAAGTNLNPDLFFRALCLEACAAGAPDHGIEKVGMNIFLHRNLRLSF
jgi:hypothetical protein